MAETTAIYSVSNKADGNTVVMFERGDDGSFAAGVEFVTGGTGTGDLEIPALKKDPTHPLLNGDDPLISANAIATLYDGNALVVVNPGSANVSLLQKNADGGLTALGTAPATDKFPVSLATHGSLIVVASVGSDNNQGSIGLMRVKPEGLVAIDGSRRDLAARPSTVAFSSDGRHVIVNELVTGMINVFAVTDGALSAEPVSRIASPRGSADRFHAIPVGFDVHDQGSHDVIVMSEARFLTPDFALRGPTDGVKTVVQSPLYTWQTGSLSTYALDHDGAISLVSADVLTGAAMEHGELANCWVAMSSDGTKVWAANALSSSISSFNVGKNGEADLIDAVAFKDPDELIFFSDMAISDDDSELYQLVGNRGEVMVFAVQPNGGLTHKQTVAGLPALGAFGLVAVNH